ncbi:MAG: HAD-IA family hydrolase [Alphaproteobacteria bacterium]|nr:HAD-IA family hydrolase [Alphaproteobacteria bacterium]
MAISSLDLIIFDCDGVLIDSEILSANTLIALLGKLGVHIDFAYVQKNFIGRSFQKVASEIGERFKIHLPQGFETQYRHELLKSFETQLQPTPNVAETLQQLDIKICVATSSSPERVARSLQITKLINHFDGNIFTASQVKNGKPAPDLFLLAAQTMGVSPANCLVIEDSQPGIEAAIKAHMPVWHYNGGSHLKGVKWVNKSGYEADQTFSNWQNFIPLLSTI